MKKRVLFCLIAVLSIGSAAKAQDIPTSGEYYRIKNVVTADTYIGGNTSGTSAVTLVEASENPEYQVFLLTGDNTAGWRFLQEKSGYYMTHANVNNWTMAYGTGNNLRYVLEDKTSHYMINRFGQSVGVGYDSPGTLYSDKNESKGNQWVFDSSGAADLLRPNLTNALADAQAFYDANSSEEGASTFLAAITAADGAKTSSSGAAIMKAVADLKNATLFLEASMGAFSPGNPADCTYKIVNPSFETGDLTGWVNNGMQIQSNVAFPKEGTFYCEKYQPGSVMPDASASQLVSGLPNGKYVVTVHGKFGDKGAYVFGNSNSTQFDGDDVAKEYSVETVVIDGTINIGVRVLQAEQADLDSTHYLPFDNFRLYYLGVDLNDMLTALQNQVTVANTISGKMQGTVAAELSDAINAAQAILDNASAATQADIENVATVLTAATNAASASVVAYAALDVAITDAQAIVDTYVDGEDKTTIDAAIAVAQGVYDDATEDVAGVDAANATLKAELRLFGLASASETNPFELTDQIVNPNFDSGITGWSRTTTAQNNTTATNQNFGAFEGTMPFWENWNGSPYTGKMYQVVNGLPAGRYRLQIGVFANNGGEGLFVYAGDSETPVSNANPAANFRTEVVISGGSLEIGLNIKSGMNNWVGIDNVKLYYLGEVSEPVLNVVGNYLFFTESATEQTFTVSGLNLTDDITLSSGVDGITFSPASIAKDADGISEGIVVTATFDPAFDGAATASGAITVSTAGVDSKIVAIVTSIDSECFVPLYPELTNLAPDPFFNDVSQMKGWGARSLVVDPSKAFCGAGVGFSNGGSYDQLIPWEANTKYLVQAMVHANGTNVKLGVYGIGKADIEELPVDKDNWELVKIIFTTGENPGTGGVFLNSAGATGAYIDNLEVYDVTNVIITSINKDIANDEIVVYSRDMQIVGEISTSVAANANITVYNLQGMRLDTQSVVCNEGVNQFVVNKDLPSGVYVVQININGVSHTVKLMK